MATQGCGGAFFKLLGGDSVSDTAGGQDEAWVQAGPTKRFFVSMLTRDIALDDAILDLLDNCIDGAMRSMAGKLDGPQPFKDFWAKVTINDQKFEIHDNCGGIAWDTFKNHAFVLGRPDISRDKNLPTIGMYGIGMKRAIFKIADEATVATQVDGEAYSVTYTEEWLDADNNDDWKLPVVRAPKILDERGTKITASKLRDEIHKQFSDDTDFIDKLRQKVSQYFGHIIEGGFKIEINTEEVPPHVLFIHAQSHEPGKKESAIEPYVFSADYNGVQIVVIVGFRGPLPRESEIWDEMEAPRTSEDAGVSIICNDRVIILNDKTRLTGWGDGAPKYHNQFIAIAGIAFFKSNDPNLLPVSTTKRQLDAGSDVYLFARARIIEGLKQFTDFTNRWKGMEDETEQYFKSAPRQNAKSSIRLATQRGTTSKRAEGGKIFSPTLPLPETKNPLRRISYSKQLEEIRQVSERLFGTPDADPNDVGRVSFENVLKDGGEGK